MISASLSVPRMSVQSLPQSPAAKRILSKKLRELLVNFCENLGMDTRNVYFACRSDSAFASVPPVPGREQKVANEEQIFDVRRQRENFFDDDEFTLDAAAVRKVRSKATDLWGYKHFPKMEFGYFSMDGFILGFVLNRQTGNKLNCFVIVDGTETMVKSELQMQFECMSEARWEAAVS